MPIGDQPSCSLARPNSARHANLCNDQALKVVQGCMPQADNVRWGHVGAAIQALERARKCSKITETPYLQLLRSIKLELIRLEFYLFPDSRHNEY
jgi:hypothetical protein